MPEFLSILAIIVGVGGLTAMGWRFRLRSLETTPMSDDERQAAEDAQLYNLGGHAHGLGSFRSSNYRPPRSGQ